MPISTVVGRPSTPCGLRGDKTSSALQVAPSAVEFSAFEGGSCYVATLSVRNSSDRVVRFRLTPPPHASPFRVFLRGRDIARTENATVTLPPGLSVKYEVAFEISQVETETNSDGDEPQVDVMPAIVHDVLQLKGDDGSTLEVPLMARRACPLLEVVPALCDLGLVVLTQRSAKCIQVKNSGARPGRFVVDVLRASNLTNSTTDLVGSRAGITVSPQRGKLVPQETVNLKVEANGLETGAFRGIVRLRIWEMGRSGDEEDEDAAAPQNSSRMTARSGIGSTHGTPTPSAEKILDVSGTVVEHTAELVLRQGLEAVHSLFFGSLFAGETRTIETLLRNNGPQPLTFKASISFSGGAGGGAAVGVEEDREAYERRKELRITPVDGCIDPFSEAVVTFIYHPRARTSEEIQQLERKNASGGLGIGHDPEDAGSNSSLDSSSSPFLLLPAPAQPLSAFASIICEDLQAQNLTFEVSAKMFIPRLQLSPTPPLDFGDVRSYDRADILLSLKNLSGLPVRFEIPKGVAHYSVNPRTGRLDVLQSQSLVVSFAPTQLGTFNSILSLRINDGVLEIPLKVLGRAAVVGSVPPVSERLVRGPFALPADFAPKYKFLLPEEAKQTKGKLSRRFQRQPPYELAALNGTAALDEFEFQGTNNTHLTYCVKELARRADHRAAYHEYLAQCRVQREQKAKGWKGKAQGLKTSVAQARGNNQEDDDVPNSEDVDLGMTRDSRPQPQELRLPPSLVKPNDPLWLSQHPAGGKTGQSKAFFDEFKLIKKKFKAFPATPAELADCARTLEFDELEQVVSGPKTLNFGRLSVNGSATRSLTVQNNSQHNILVALHFGNASAQKDGAPGQLEELSRKTPLTSQVVPPRSKAGFDLIFCSSREQFFQQSITYSLNGVHPRQVTIVAEVAPIVVELAPEDLRFEFGALDLSTAVTRDVVITNTCDSEAPFVWTRLPLLATSDGTTRPDSSKSSATTTITTTTMTDKGNNTNNASAAVFEVLPASGTLAPSSTMVCKVMYTPPSTTGPAMSALGISQRSGAMWLAQMFQLDVTGGEKGAMNCRALLPEVKVVAREKKVDFGTISVGVEREKRVTLTNLGLHTRAVFYASVDPPSMTTTIGLQVTPAQGVVDPQESTELTVKLLPHRAISLDGTTGSHQVNIVVALRGGKVLRLPVSASVLVPDVFLAPAEAIDFGEVVLGVSVPRVISLENHSSIPACLLLDLGSSSFSTEFALATPPRLIAHLEDASNIFVPLTDDKPRDSANSQEETEFEEDAAQNDARCSKWQICLPPHATVSCHLVFTPMKEGSYDLVLPLQIAGVGSHYGTGTSGTSAPLKRRVLARAIAPRLRFSSSTMHFNRCVITREGIRKVPYTKQLVLTNDHDQPIRWQIDTSRLRQGNLVTFAAGAAAATLAASVSSGAALAKRIASANPTNSATAVVFHVAPDQGELASGEEVTIRVSFLPLDAVEYTEDELPLLVDGEPYVNLSLRGEGIHPHLSFSTNRVVLPTVPLGVTSSASFQVHATGYDHVEVACRVPLDTARAPLTVLFPQGKTLSMACPSLPVELRFSSTASVAFNAKLEFFDADGNSFALPVAGCAENCLFTNYDFLQTNGLAAEGVDENNNLLRSTQPRKEPGKSDTDLDNISITAVATGEHHGSASNTNIESDGKPPSNFQFYTHMSGRFPVYLLSSRQAQAESEKAKELQVVTAHHQALNGFVVVDPSTGIDEDNSSSSGTIATNQSASMLTLQVCTAGSSSTFSEGEIQLLMQYLNANFLRTPVIRFPEDFADNGGRPLYELLDMVCIKKPGGLAVSTLRGAGGSTTNSKRKNATTESNTAAKTNGGAGTNSTTSASVPQPSKKDQLTQFVNQYVELLRFLRSYGAMVHDVYPEHLLAQEFYLRACENPHADPALLSSPSYATLPFVARRRALKNEWRTVSTNAWMKVLYQVTKCFLLSRITWKGYQMQVQGDHEPSTGDAKARDEKRKGEKQTIATGRACQGSNIYSEAEMVLMQWLCDRVRSLHKPQQPAIAPMTSLGGALLETQLLDIGRDLRDGRWLFHLVAAHIPTLSVDQSVYHCFRWMPEATASRPRRPPSAAQLQHQTGVLLQTLGAFGLDFGLDSSRFLLRYSGREMLLLLLHLQQTLPQFIPKATIEFRGGLGQVMEKSIELKNPSARPLRYHVFLDGADRNSAAVSTFGAVGASTSASEFTIESNELVLDPGQTIAFVVTFRPRFSRKAAARLVFQAVRGDIAGATCIGGGGATMVFLLESNIVSRKPVRIIQIETKTYEKRVEEIAIENQFPANANFKLSMTQQQQTPPSGAESAALFGSGSSTVANGMLPSSRGGNRRRSVQDRPGTGTQGANSSSSFGMGSDVAGFSGKKHSIVSSKNRGEDGDLSWCICAQQPFYLPDFGTSGSSSNGNVTGDDSFGVDGGGLSVPPSGLGLGSGASVAIRKNASAKVKLEFLPLVPGNYRCQLLFLDENIGEFLYEVHAVAHLPASLEMLTIECEASSAAIGAGGAARFRFVRELTIPMKNPLLNRALTVFVERANGHLRTKLKDGLKRCEENHHATFHVDFNSPYFTANVPELTLSTGSGKLLPASGRSDGSGMDGSGPKVPLKANQARLGTPRSVSAGANSVLIDFQPKGAGRYACKLLLRSRNTVCGSSDLRVYDLIAKVKEPNVKTQLEFVAPARHSIVQEIPLSNPTDATWSLKAVFSHGNTDAAGNAKSPASMFSGPASLVVPAKRSATYPLTFTPSWMYHDTRTFVLLNTATQQQFEFELSGYGEEPLAQDHVVLNCQARSSIVHNFEVFALPGGNGSGDSNASQVFKVESDLRDVVGASTITIASGSGGASRVVKYPLTFSPLVSGSYFGSVTFTNEATNEYLWYTVEASVSPPEPETTLEMRAPVRGAVGVEIGLANPLEWETTFTVELRGRGLLGPSTFTLEAHESGVYELVYSPLLVTTGNGEEGAVLFSSDAVGQFWYRLNLVAEPAAAQSLDDMSCAVGDVCTQPLWLQNPSDQELQLQYRVTNTRNFSIKGSSSTTTTGNNTGKTSTRVLLSPFGRASVIVEYTPSSLSDLESTSIVFSEKDVASDWEFTVRGRGRAPSVMKPLVVTARVNEAATTLFTFKNPFAAPLRVDVKLVAEESERSPKSSSPPSPRGTLAPVFDMLLKKRRVLLESFGLFQVPISFLPRAVSETCADLVVHGGDEYAELEWRYPLRGVAEAPIHPRILAVLACQARDSVEKRVDCELLAAPDNMVLTNETYTVEWEIDAERFGPMATATAIERALTVTPLPVPSNSRSTYLLPYTIRFEPLRPYRGSVALLLKKKSGGLWRFDVSLDAGDPPVDDVLSIESSLNQTSSVSFQLRNQFRQSAAFLAEFSAGSSSAFTVYPAEGELPPYGSEDGAVFVVSFTPTGYGKMQSGQLVICTEEMQWTFNVKGVYPDATPSSRATGPASSLSLSSSASRARLGITSSSNGSNSNEQKSKGRATKNL